MMMMKKMQHQRQQQADHANGEQPAPGHPLPNLILVMVLPFPPLRALTPPVPAAPGGLRGLERMLLARCPLQRGDVRDTTRLSPPGLGWHSGSCMCGWGRPSAVRQGGFAPRWFGFASSGSTFLLRSRAMLEGVAVSLQPEPLSSLFSPSRRSQPLLDREQGLPFHPQNSGVAGSHTPPPRRRLSLPNRRPGVGGARIPAPSAAVHTSVT